MGDETITGRISDMVADKFSKSIGTLVIRYPIFNFVAF